MNQGTRIVRRTCAECRKNAAYVRQVYNRHISDWEDVEMPICEECEKKSEEEKTVGRDERIGDQDDHTG